MKRKKYQLPLVAELPHIEIDLTKLKSALESVSDKFKNVREANPALCDNHMELANAVYDNFDQINLTELNGDPMPFTADIKERIRRKEECLYNKPTEYYKNTYFEELINQFRNPAMRVRITRLAGGTVIPFHIDYDPTYATRVVIPIISNESVINRFKNKGVIESYYLAPGKAYFLNTGFSHAVFNNSQEDRIALMFSLDGQDDLEGV